MEVSRQFKPKGRRIPWLALFLGLAFGADAVWSLFWPINAYHFSAGIIVAGIAVERLLHAFAIYWAGRTWPWRLSEATLTTAGLELHEVNVYGGEDRQTTLPGGLLLQAEVKRGSERGIDAPYIVLLYSILGTVIWSEHNDRAEAESVRDELQRVLDARPEGELEPPPPTGALDIIPDSRAVMWGRAKVIPAVVAARCVALLIAIAAVPGMVPFPDLDVALWGLVAITVALLSFPFLAAATALLRDGRLMGFGMTARFDELRSYERSSPHLTTRLGRVHHVGFGELRLSGGPIALRLVAFTDEDSDVEAYVSRSPMREMSHQTFRLLANSYDPPASSGGKLWSVRLPGGVAEAVEAASWAQRFVAEGRERPVVN